jgi:predicted DNA-binding transcriptional regulator YafY
VAGVGQRTPTETLFGIIAAFVEDRTWSQAALARRLETRPETIRRRLEELQAGGFKLERSVEHPQVYWSVPKHWFPGALLFKADEVRDLLRLLGRAPRGALRAQILGLVVSRLSNLGNAGASAVLEAPAVQPPVPRDDAERWLAVAEDAVSAKVPMKMRYFTASRRDESWRHVSVHRVDHGPRPHVIGTCHTANALRRFRVSNVLDARLDPGEEHRPVTAEALQSFDDESFGAFRQQGPAVDSAFFVRDSEASWVARNLPDDRIRPEAARGGTRFRVTTSAVDVLARFVVGLGDVATAETPELAAAVAKLARGALANATPNAGGAATGLA